MGAYYFDDEEKGLARETSHPFFIAHATADFYYDSGDGLSPFGSDTGSDTLHFLEEWYEERRAGEKAKSFLNNMLEEWGFGTQYLLLSEPAQFATIKYETQHYTDTVDQAVIAITFGQFKIAGRADKAMLALASDALKRQRYLVDQAKRQKPAPWIWADKYLERLTIMEQDLTSMANKKAR